MLALTLKPTAVLQNVGTEMHNLENWIICRLLTIIPIFFHLQTNFQAIDYSSLSCRNFQK